MATQTQNLLAVWVKEVLEAKELDFGLSQSFEPINEQHQYVDCRPNYLQRHLRTIGIVDSPPLCPLCYVPHDLTTDIFKGAATMASYIGLLETKWPSC